MDLASIYNRNDLVRPIAAANQQLSHAATAAVASTALMISEIQSFDDDNAPRSRFDPQTLILLPPGSTQLPNDTVRQYLHRLALVAEATAAESACSSILAGPGSESDDTGDVALWLGKGDFQTPELVLNGLGLNGEMKMTEFSPPAQLAGLLEELKDAFSFRVQARMTGGVVIFFLLGRVEEAGWGGLAGIGTWT